MKLLYREKKYFDELFDDYVSRVSALNGFENERKFLRILYAEFRSLYGNCLVGNSKERKRRSLEWVLKRNIEIEDEGYRYPPWERSIRKNETILKVCDLCLSEKKYVRFYWRENWYEYCHIHKCELISCENIWGFEKGIQISEECSNDRYMPQYRFVERAIAHAVHNGSVIESAWKEYMLIDVDVSSISSISNIIKENFSINLGEHALIRKVKHGLLFGKGFSERAKIIVSDLSKNNPQLKALVFFLFVVEKISNQARPPYPKIYWAYGLYSDWAKNEIFASEEMCSLWVSLKINPLNPRRELPHLNISGINAVRRLTLMDLYYRIQDIDEQFTERKEPWLFNGEMKNRSKSKRFGNSYDETVEQACTI